MTEKQTGVRIPDDEAAVVDTVAEARGRERAEEHRELLVAQAELIGDP